MSQERLITDALSYALLDGMHDPTQILEDILSMSIAELKDKFKHYGNSYLEIAPSYSEGVNFWRVRLDNEVQEYRRAITPAERKRKLANLFNLVWMSYAWELKQEGREL